MRENWKPDLEQNGILVIDKEPGLTSFQVVAKVRRMLGLKRVGHCGTLDPFATGVLPVAFGRGTAVIQYMEAYRKTYQVLARLGQATDTLDSEGEIREQIPEEAVWQRYYATSLEQDFQRALKRYTGDFQQIPPMYSALKHKGKPLYTYARAGQEIERPARPVNVCLLDWRILTLAEIEAWQQEKSSSLLAAIAEDAANADYAGRALYLYAEADVSKGTYIRSWIDDLGKEAGCPAYCVALRRTACGPYQLNDRSRTISLLERDFRLRGEDRSGSYQAWSDANIIWGLDSAFPGMPRLELTGKTACDLIDGKRPEVAKSIYARYVDQDLLAYYGDKFLALANVKLSGDQSRAYLETQRVFCDKSSISISEGV